MVCAGINIATLDNVIYATFISPKPGKNITITDIKVINYGFYGLCLNQYCHWIMLFMPPLSHQNQVFCYQSDGHDTRSQIQ